MSKNVIVNETDYTGVSVVQLPTTGGGTAEFRDVDEITTPSGEKTITANGTYDVTEFAKAIVSVASGDSSGSAVSVSAFTVEEDSDRSLYLNANPIKLVSGLNVILSNKMLYNETAPAYAQGNVAYILLYWDGVACNGGQAGITPVHANSHVKGFIGVEGSSHLLGSQTNICSGNTTKMDIAEDGTMTFTTSATGVTTGNYNNSYFAAGTWYLIQAPCNLDD